MGFLFYVLNGICPIEWEEIRFGDRIWLTKIDLLSLENVLTYLSHVADSVSEITSFSRFTLRFRFVKALPPSGSVILFNVRLPHKRLYTVLSIIYYYYSITVIAMLSSEQWIIFWSRALFTSLLFQYNTHSFGKQSNTLKFSVCCVSESRYAVRKGQSPSNNPLQQN